MLGWLMGLGSPQYDLPEEELEDLRMTSGLEPEEIMRLRKAFFQYTNGAERMSKNVFLDITSISINPLKERIAREFGFDKPPASLDFANFLVGAALFNSHGKRDEKLRLAFRLQDMDDDGVISRDDLRLYLETVTGQPNTVVNGWDGPAIADVVEQVFLEVSSAVVDPAKKDPKDPHKREIKLHDFSKCMASTDFHTKLQILF